MSAETLRRAAALMRERAEAATPGVWRHTEHGIEAGEYAEVIVPGRVECMAYCYGGSSTLDGDRIDLDGDHIASWHPAVALAVADLLDLLARRSISTDLEHAERDAALAVARAYLGDDG